MEKGDWDRIKKEGFAYNDKGQMIIYYFYDWEHDTDEIIFATEYGLNSDGHVMSRKNYRRPSGSDTLKHIDSEKTEFSYDKKGDLIISEYQCLANKKKWTEVKSERRKHHIERDGNGNIILKVKSLWEEKKHKWEYYYKEEYEYDSAGNETMYAAYRYDKKKEFEGKAKMWIGERKHVNTYNNGRRTVAASYNWDREKNKWKGWYNIHLDYDSNQKCTMFLEHDWNEKTRKWDPDYKEQYVYSDNGSELSCSRYEWQSGSLTETYKEENKYNEQGDIYEISIHEILPDNDILSETLVISLYYSGE